MLVGNKENSQTFFGIIGFDLSDVEIVILPYHKGLLVVISLSIEERAIIKVGSAGIGIRGK